MNSKPTELKPTSAVNDEPEFALNADEIEQLAKFLDILLEIDIATRSNGGNVND